MDKQRLKDQINNMFPGGPRNYEEEKRLRNILNRYQIPYTEESINKILKVDLNETVKEHQEHRQEA